MSLRLKLILVLLLALMLPVAVSQWQMLGNFNQVQRNSQREHLQTSVDAIAELLQGIERDALFNARLMAASGELDRYLKRTQYRLPDMTTYRALLKSWSVYLKHNAHYYQIAYVEKSGVAPVQFSLRPSAVNLDLSGDIPFQQAVTQNLDEFIWYRRAPDSESNTLSIYAAHGVTPFNAGDVVRRSNQVFSGYMVIRIDIDSRHLDSASIGLDNDRQVMDIRLHDQIIVSAGTRQASSPARAPRMETAKRLHAEHSLNTDIAIHSSMPLSQIDWFDPVLLRAGMLSLLQFAAAAVIFFLIVHRWLVQPLQHGLALTQQLAEGHWLGKNRFSRRDEMGALIQSLHTMSDQLQQATVELESRRALAEQAERLKTEFLANISHEIRTPVNIIVGVMNRLGRFVTEPRQKEYLDSATTEAYKLVHKIDELILLADLETKKHQLRSEEFYIPDVIQRAIARFLPIAQQKQLTFDARIDDTLNEVVQGDSQKMAKVLDVLLDNALKFTDHGSIELTVRVLQVQDDGVLCEFAVQDTGCGIDASLIPALGKAFAQGDGSIVRAHNGLGMGLAIANGFLALMQSRLEIQSMPGEGSRFSFTLLLQRFPRADRQPPRDGLP